MEGHLVVALVLRQDLPQDHRAPAPKLHQVQVNRATSVPGSISCARVLLMMLCCILVYIKKRATPNSHVNPNLSMLYLTCLLDLFFGMHENSCGERVLWVLPSPARVSWHLQT